jgi:hypothetical protein
MIMSFGKAKESDHVRWAEMKKWPKSQHVVRSTTLIAEWSGTSDWTVETQGSIAGGRLRS